MNHIITMRNGNVCQQLKYFIGVTVQQLIRYNISSQNSNFISLRVTVLSYKIVFQVQSSFGIITNQINNLLLYKYLIEACIINFVTKKVSGSYKMKLPDAIIIQPSSFHNITKRTCSCQLPTQFLVTEEVPSVNTTFLERSVPTEGSTSLGFLLLLNVYVHASNQITTILHVQFPELSSILDSPETNKK